ncbi:hypothetical protein EO244_01250 [Ancylomarina salipaludis]|uniref:NACHT domain-containing protein n=1 Tax=Ancylomarina salipaludis TaxID=2501299 RepID=A0A4Q1JQ80_9BACT|nr:hypothetical protein [Ancylomarina salipaludis]RXQ97543.1 hypothetical protein EO244_01250 [Ancylomarina salipaludis]
MLEHLKKEILKKFGQELAYNKDCEALAEIVCDATGGRISATTIRRLFGLLKSPSAPSKFTLDLLANYVSYKSWNDFQSNYIPEEKGEGNIPTTWEAFQKRAFELSSDAYNLIKGQSGIPFKSVATRKIGEDRIHNFLQSDKMALSFVAPGGAGKSTMLAKWYERVSQDSQNKDVILFFNATFMINCLNSDFMLERWLEEQLNSTSKTYLKHFLDKPKTCEGKIILILDALDEVSYDNTKLERLFLQLNQFVANRKDSKNMKLILTSRTSTWEKFVLPFIQRENSLYDAWYEIDLDLDQEDKRNFPPLNGFEIQHVFDETINQQFFYELKVENLDYYQRNTISNPFFLELFIKTYSPNKKSDINDGYKLINEFLKNKIYYSRYSEEKIDILKAILKILKYGKDSHSVKKMELKSILPIHLKTAGNYYYAYEEMLSYGLISEYVSVNEYNGYCKFVKIYNEQLFEVLLVKELIENNGGISFDLFKQIEEEYQEFELKDRLIAQLFSIAVESDNYESLSRFFELNEGTLTSSAVTDILTTVITNMDDSKIDLIKTYASGTRSVEFMLALSGNLNRLCGDFSKVVEIISETNADESVRIKSLSLLLMTSLMSLEQELSDKYYNLLVETKPNSGCSAYSIALRFTSILFYNHISGKSNDIELLKVFYYRQMAYCQVGDRYESWSGEFEVLVCNALFYMQSYHKVIQLIDDAELFYDQLPIKAHFSNHKLLRAYKLVAQSKLGMKLSASQVQELEFCNDSLISSKAYPVQIFFKSFLAGIYFEDGNRDFQERHSNRAFAISEFARYDFCKVSLLTKMAKYYNAWGETTKENLCLKERDQILQAKKAESLVKILND